MTNREKLHEIAGRLGADADLAVVRAALLALIRVLLRSDFPQPDESITILSIKKMILRSFGICQSLGDLVEPRTPDELFLAANMKLLPMCRDALDELLTEGKVERTKDKAANEAPFYELRSQAPVSPSRDLTARAIADIQGERDAMVARARRGTQRDDEKTPGDWAASLRKVIDPGHPIVMGDVPVALRHMWVKVGAVALRAVESIDRKRDA